MGAPAWAAFTGDPGWRGQPRKHVPGTCDDEVTARRQVPRMKLEALTGQIIAAAIDVHSALGPGLLESAYRTFLRNELSRRGLAVESEVPLPAVHNGAAVEVGYRRDLLVEKLIVVELKVVAALLPVHHAQLLTYLKLSQLPVGLLINFNVQHLRHGIKRVVN